VTVLSDEIHCDLIFSGHKHIPFASLGKEVANRTITCVSPTKTFNLAGIAVSAVIVPNQVIREQLAAAFLRYSIDLTNTFAVVAFETAFREGGAWLDELLIYLRKNQNTIQKHLVPHAQRVDFHASEGTYLAWIDFRKTGWSADTLAHNLVHSAGVAVEPGTKFGTAGAGFARLNFACPNHVIVEAMTRIEQMLEVLP
jgi:cystathionine beta-lyase